jgi:hypothetical protein
LYKQSAVGRNERKRKVCGVTTWNAITAKPAMNEEGKDGISLTADEPSTEGTQIQMNGERRFTETEYLDRWSSQCSSVSPGKCWDSTLK